MSDDDKRPAFMGGTILEHVTVIVGLCRFQHVSLPLCATHALSWSVTHVALFTLALALFGKIGAIVFGAIVIAWALRMDLLVGLSFALLEFGYAMVARELVLAPLASRGTATVVALSLVSIVLAFALEGGMHRVFQGHLPPPPPRSAMPVAQRPLGLIYFAIFFGPFVMALDLTMRLTGYRSALDLRVQAIANAWHREAADAAAQPTLRDWHERAMEPSRRSS